MFKNKNDNGTSNLCGVKIAQLRKQLPSKTSQRQLAEKLQGIGLDLDKNAIQRIESGERFVTDIELKAFSEIFAVPMDAICVTDYDGAPVTSEAHSRI